MNLVQIASSINQNLRFKMGAPQISSIISQVQIQMMAEDMLGFMVQSQVPLYTNVPVLSTGYVISTADIGTTVTQATSGFTGTLRGFYKNTVTPRYELVIERSNTADDWNAANLVITNTGSLTATSDSTQDMVDASDFKGPYNYPTEIPCRKMWGISLVADTAIYGTQFNYTSERDDYGIAFDSYDERRFLLPARKDPISRTITLINAPNIPATESNYRFWYWRKALEITDFTTQQDRLVIDEAYHDFMVQGCIMSAKIMVRDGNYTQEDVTNLYKGYWKRIREEYEPMGKNSNQVSEGNWP